MACTFRACPVAAQNRFVRRQPCSSHHKSDEAGLFRRWEYYKGEAAVGARGWILRVYVSCEGHTGIWTDLRRAKGNYLFAMFRISAVWTSKQCAESLLVSVFPGVLISREDEVEK